MVEQVDTLVSEASPIRGVQVRILLWAPNEKTCWRDRKKESWRRFCWRNSDDQEVSENENPTDCAIFINCPQLGVKFTPDGYKGEITDFIEFNSDMNKFLLKLNGSINNLKYECPNYIIEVIYEQ